MKLLAPVTSRIHSLCGETFPSSYFAIDTETTGFKRGTDLIVEWGHVIVRDRKIINQTNIVINWYEHPDIPERWLTNRLEEVRRAMAYDGKNYRITPELLRDKGVSPAKVIPWLYDLMETVYQQKDWLISHNGVRFDLPMLASHFEKDLGEEMLIWPDRLVDTGAIEKATQMLDDTPDDVRLYPKRDETLQEYFGRIANWKAPGVYWNVEHCVKKYGLADDFNIDEKLLHTAGYDAHVVHLLIEKFRNIVGNRRMRPPTKPLQTQDTSPRRRRQRNR